MVYDIVIDQTIYLILTKLQLIFQNSFSMLAEMGRAPEQVTSFLEEMVRPLLERYEGVSGGDDPLTV